MTISRRTLEATSLVFLVGLALIAIAPGAPRARGSEGGPRAASATLVDAAGSPVGVVRFTPSSGGDTRVDVSVDGLSPGFHGFHVHSVGECVAPFTSAGGHFNPTSATHGSHAGDMPPLLVGEDGSADATFTTDRFDVAALMDADGSAVIVHAAPDNLAHIPTRYHSHTEDVFGPDSATLATGDAGARVACGVVG